MNEAELLARIGVALSDSETKINRLVGEAKQVFENGKSAELEVAQLASYLEVLDETIVVLNSYADQRASDLQTTVETLVTHGLRTIFGGDMSFHLKPGMKGKYATMDFIVRSRTPEGEEVDTSIMDSRGGGVAAVVGFLIRLVLLLLHPGKRHILFLDETFAQLSAEYEPRLAEFIAELVRKTDVQIVMVTHSDQYADAADVGYRFRLVNGVTEVERV